jgi:hypothetical protein
MLSGLFKSALHARIGRTTQVPPPIYVVPFSLQPVTVLF